MLKTARVIDTASANRLIQLWTDRYLPDLSILPQQKGEFPVAELVETASSEGRAKTVHKVLQLLQLNCEQAGLATHTLFLYIPNIVDLSEARRIAHYVGQVYEATLEIYKRQQPLSDYLQYMDTSSLLFSKLALPSLMLPAPTSIGSRSRTSSAPTPKAALSFLQSPHHRLHHLSISFQY
ncbi:MAG: hypothetical protein HC772_14530 [Leptolyngbyaceae cyanobacterium CRU_2_3]|nr:hypothetical protein [Leptolyngbyaceae cyanobacterium CRU_2_3]